MSESIVCVSISSILENSVDINEISDRQVKTNQVRSQLFWSIILKVVDERMLILQFTNNVSKWRQSNAQILMVRKRSTQN